MPESKLIQIVRDLLLGPPKEPEEPENEAETPDSKGLKARIGNEVGYAKGESKEGRSPGHPE